MFDTHSHHTSHFFSKGSYSTDLTTEIRHHLHKRGGLDFPTYGCRAHAHDRPILVSPDREVGGLSQAEWGDAWWQWAYSFPNNVPGSTNPLFDDSSVGTFEGQPIAQNGLVYNLVGSYNSQPIGVAGFRSQAVRGDFENGRIYVRDNQYIFAPILNTVADNGGADGAWTIAGLPSDQKFTEAEMRRLNNSAMQTLANLFLEVDGKSLISDATNWQDYRQASPDGGFSYTPPENNILSPQASYPPGVTVQPAVSDGYWFMLNPLSQGNHTIHFGGILDTSKLNVDLDGNPDVKTEEEKLLDAYYGSGVPGARFELDITYNITVVHSNFDISALAS